ncbi:MAG: XTP/dITP diphosphatase [Chlamydiota bacterium]
MELVIASGNLHKIREFRAILKSVCNFKVLSLLDFPHYSLPEETEKTFEGNAILKAVHAASHLKSWVIADDSGLVVPALQGAPGVYSARYAGNEATDAENRRKLLHEMRNLKDDERNAYFSCSIAIAAPDGLKKSVTATCEGIVLKEERGGHGFGYDPLFIKHDYSKTFAELDEDTKNRISHRRKALDKLLPFLETINATDALV